ncbi:HTH_48 domain-containing protein, partial [Trichonephila inaurata madagascariensis]
EGEKPAAIHRRIVTVYGEKCVSDKSVRKWSARFRAGRESVGQRPGQANTVITSDLIDKVNDLVRSDRRVTLRLLALKVDVSYGTVWTIVHDRSIKKKYRAAHGGWGSFSITGAPPSPESQKGNLGQVQRGRLWTITPTVQCPPGFPWFSTEETPERGALQLGDVLGDPRGLSPATGFVNRTPRRSSWDRCAQA